MSIFLTIQNTYHDVQLALFNKTLLLEQSNIDKKQASKMLTVELKQLLAHHSIALQKLPFIAVNQGPGPFTTLRVVIACVNGLSFASNIPLIGVDAFDAMLAEWNDPAYPITIVLFNAFSEDVYFAIQQPKTPICKGYNNIDLLLEQCTDLPGTIRFIGNGTQLYAQKIKDSLGDRAYIPEPTADCSSVNYSSIAQIAKLGYQQWNTVKKGSRQLLPLYLKKHPAQLLTHASDAHE